MERDGEWLALTTYILDEATSDEAVVCVWDGENVLDNLQNATIANGIEMRAVDSEPYITITRQHTESNTQNHRHTSDTHLACGFELAIFIALWVLAKVVEDSYEHARCHKKLLLVSLFQETQRCYKERRAALGLLDHGRLESKNKKALVGCVCGACGVCVCVWCAGGLCDQ